MSLADRSRAVAEAGRGREALRAAMLMGGTLAAGIGFSIGHLGLAAAGALIVGLELGQAMVNPERAYMEGFSDGLVTAPELDERGAPAARRRGRDSADVRGLPGGAPADDAGAADGPGGPAGGDDAGAEPRRPAGGNLAAQFGVDIDPGPARPANDAIAIEARTLAQGPGRSPFPQPIPAAVAVPSPIQPGRTPIGRKARRRERSFDQRNP